MRSSADAPGSSRRTSYHHGDLRVALLKAAVEELEEHGVEAFTLRGCARRAGVSHAAPAHHFGDVTGLLTAVATQARDRLAASIAAQSATAAPGSEDHLIATATGYVRFALGSPGEFHLMFRSERLRLEDPDLIAAGNRSFGLAADAVAAFLGIGDAMAEPAAARRVVALWSLAHGFADLLLAGQLGPPDRAGALTDALLPDMVREAFGLAARDRPRDLNAIARAAAARGRPRLAFAGAAG